MNIDLSAGKYVVAVSGGVDSMVLLDLLTKKTGLELVMAHFNHGIRPDSIKDEVLVKKTAQKLGLLFEVGHGNLGSATSEATAREARYRFFNKIKQKHRATAIITAHHQDDLIETALINLLRGTGWRGLASIRDDNNLKRPLLGHPKAELINYARKNHLRWREDSTNQSTDYLRNYLRHSLLSNLPAKDRKLLLSKINSVAKSKSQMNKQIATISQLLLKGNTINRDVYSTLPRKLSREVLVNLLNSHESPDINQQQINSLDLAIRTALPGKRYPISKHSELKIGAREATLLRI